MHQDTIAAISTPLGEGAIGVVRVSGSNAVPVVDNIFSGRTSLLEVESHTVHYGFLLDPENRQPIDEVLVTVMRSPRTFTREDVVEVSGHGGIFVIQRVLQAILSSGARLAEPGEFTKRAFLNGRLDLSQAEAVMDLIRAKSDEASSLALKQVEGRLSHRIRDLRRELIQVLAHIEVTIDYPEHDVEDVTYQLLTDKAKDVKDEVGRMILYSRQGRVLREGVVTAIVGRPNVGKSSLLNALARQNRAIVTDIPGTTRDVIEESVIVGGVPLLLQDTAGIRETEDRVEKMGVQRSKEVMSDAELILLVFNGSEELSSEDRELLQWVAGRNALAIINKTDLPERIDSSFLETVLPGKVVRISLLLGDGLDELELRLRECFLSGEVSGSDLTYVSNSRHIALLQEVDRRLDDALRALDEKMPVDMAGIDLREAWSLLGEVIGEEVGEGLIDQIFTQFCLGK